MEQGFNHLADTKELVEEVSLVDTQEPPEEMKETHNGPMSDVEMET